jgi:hypothetical protein
MGQYGIGWNQFGYEGDFTDDDPYMRPRSKTAEERTKEAEQEQRRDARHHAAVRRKNEQVGHARPNDYRDRTVALMDDHGAKARLHMIDGADPEDDFVPETWDCNLSAVTEPDEDDQ